MPTWEYRTALCPVSLLLSEASGDPEEETLVKAWEETLVTAGERGWEMVGVAMDPHRGMALCFFKREKQ